MDISQTTAPASTASPNPATSATSSPDTLPPSTPNSKPSSTIQQRRQKVDLALEAQMGQDLIRNLNMSASRVRQATQQNLLLRQAQADKLKAQISQGSPPVPDNPTSTPPGEDEMGNVSIDSPVTTNHYYPPAQPEPAPTPEPSQPAPQTWTTTGIAALLAAGIAVGGLTGYAANALLNPTPAPSVVTTTPVQPTPNTAAPSPVNIVTRDASGAVTKTTPGRLWPDGKVEGQDAGGNWIQYVQDAQGNWTPKGKSP